MSLATRCPACGTTFKVVRDQLRISDGWVRCGRCSHVFDGAENLHDPAQPSPAATAPMASGDAPVQRDVPTDQADLPTPAEVDPHDGGEFEREPPPAAPQMHGQATSDVAPLADIDFFSDALSRLKVDAPASGGDAGPLSLRTITDHIPQPPRTQPVTLEAPPRGWPSSIDHSTAPAVPVIEFPADDQAPSPTSVHGIEPWSRLPSLHLGDVRRSPEATVPPDDEEADDLQLQKALRRARVKSARAERARAKAAAEKPADVVVAASEPVAAELETAEPSPASFDRLSRRPFEAPRDRGFRLGWPWRTSAVVALLLLAAQVVYQERSAIVARQPSWRPAFASACEVLGCQLASLERISEISIDGASFARERGGDGYQLSFTLRNRASMPLAMPAVELSLLDLQERVVVRRVLRPADYDAPAVLVAHGERTTLLPVALVGDDAATLPRVAGFRLGAFYP